MKQTLKRIFESYVESSWKWWVFWLVFFGLMTSFLTVLEPVVFTKIIEQIELFYKTGNFDSNTTLYWLIFWAVFIVVTIIIQYIYRYIFVYKLNMKNYVTFCKKFNTHIVWMNYWDYLWKKQGSLYKIYDRGALWQEQFLYFVAWDLIRNIGGIFFAITILLYINFKMALLALSMIPVMILMWLFFTRVLVEKQKKLNDGWDDMFGDIWNILSSFIFDIRIYLMDIFSSLIYDR